MKQLNVKYYSNKNKLLLQRDNVNSIFWDAELSATKYRVYKNTFVADAIVYEGVDLNYFEHNSQNPTIYYIIWIDSEGNESLPFTVSIP